MLKLILCLLFTIQSFHPIDKMPLIRQHKLIPAGNASAPIGKYDKNSIYYLQASVRVKNGTTRGSATICYYDGIWAYLISCGHLFSGNEKKCYIDVYYKNEQKLLESKSYETEIICFSKQQDISFLKFRPDWEISQYFPIATLDYPIKIGKNYESTGCDHAEEPASYTVEIEELKNGQMITQNNSPRPGRSGGGVMSEDGYFLGIVWGTSNYNGEEQGYCVPLKRIHEYAKKSGLGFLLEAGSSSWIVNSIPIVGKKNVNKKLIPVP